MKKDLRLVLVVAALAVAAFLLTAESAPVPPQSRDPYHPASKDAVVVKYRSEGGLSPIASFEVTVRGPGESAVRYQTRGGPPIQRTYAISDESFRDLLARLGRVDFFNVEDVPRSGYHADMASVTLACSIGEQQNQVTIDARRRSSRDLTLVLEFFNEVRKAVTPEPVSSGD